MNEARIAAFITANLRLEPVPGVPQVSLYTAHQRSGISRVADDTPPYWAWPWAGGIVLARHVLRHPELVASRRVLDFGAGGGLVAIAAAKAGAARVFAAESDPKGLVAIGLNAQANAVRLLAGPIETTPPGAPMADVVLAGDVFYAPEVAAMALPFLTRCAAAGRDVLVGDPFRRDLPVDRLDLLAEDEVADFGSGSARPVRAGVFRLSAG